MKNIISLFVILCASTLLYAQQPRSASARKSPTPNPASPTADFFVGEAKVDVTKDETVVKLAMAQHGSVLIELPANDGPRYIIPGDPEMATVDQKALERNKRAIVVRPGTQFVPPLRRGKARVPTATVTAQMKSGLVVTFLFYPVEDLAQNVHRCVLSYNRDEVVARRRAAGLPVNLDMESRGEMTVQSSAPTSITVEDSNAEKSSNPQNPAANPDNSAIPSSTVGTTSPLPKLERTNIPEHVIARAKDALQQAVKKPKQFKRWTKPVHGLALSFTAQQLVSNNYTLALIAVKNTSNDPLKLSSEAPDLFIEMTDEQGKILNVERIKKLHAEQSDSGGLIPPNGSFYYAVAYVPPVLGAHQRIRLAIGQTNAADEPASVLLTSNGR